VPAGSLERFGEPVLVLDGAARLLACNRAAEAALGGPLGELQGLAPGELLDCEHAQAAGCGNDSHCSTCGLRQAILYTQRHDRDCERLPVMLPFSKGGQAQMRCLTVSTRRLNGWVRLQLEDDGLLPQPSGSVL
jgi:PAS domain-containing protein